MKTALTSGYTSELDRSWYNYTSEDNPSLYAILLCCGKGHYDSYSKIGITSTREAFVVGQQLAEQLLHKHISKHGSYPKKVAHTL